ncbi:thiamine pyrophosphate-binding protein [Chitinimonas naiadis]
MTTKRLADYVFDLLAAEGVRQVFLLPGGGAMHLIDAVGRHPDIEYVAHHHEQAAGIAAEANGRVNENIGVAVVTTGPGATNVVTPVAGAWIESTPLLVLSGQVKRADMLRGRPFRQMGVQEVDIVSVVKPITKYAVTLEDPLMVRYHIEKALYLARHGRKGPVWLDVPLDVQAVSIDTEQLRGYDPATDEDALSPASAAPAGLSALHAALSAAKRPLFLFGHGVRLAGAAAQIAPLLEQFAVPVVTTWNALDLLPYEHDLNIGRPGAVALRAPNFAVQNCDLLIAVGARLDNVVTAYNPKQFARNARKFVIDVDAQELARHEFPDCSTIEADAADFLRALATYPAVAAPAAWRERCLAWKRRYTVCDGQAFPATGAISHFHFADAVGYAIAPDTMIVTGSSGLAVEAVYTAFRNKPGQRMFLTSGLGAMGYGLPAAIGACIAAGRQHTVLIESDGSLQLNLQELATLKSLNLPIVCVIMNNNGYASIRNSQRNYFESRFVATGPEAKLFIPDVLALAESYGLEAMRIADASELEHSLREAVAKRGPILVDVRLVENEVLWPKVAAVQQADGSMVSLPLEDMSPLLPIEELASNLQGEVPVASLLARGIPVG